MKYEYATSRDDVHRQMRAMQAVLKEFDPDQPRDERGRWTSGGGGGVASTTPPSPRGPNAAHSAAAHDAVRAVPHTQGDPNADGSMAHPIYVDGDLDHAVREIHAGHHVRLDQPRQVVTLVDKLGDMAEDAVAKGEKAPNYDLGLVTIPGTNLFTQQSLGIPRVQMPQLSGPPLPGTPADKFPKNARGSVNLGEAFRDELEHQGYKVTDSRVPAESLRATQMDLVGPQVAGMADALEQGKLNIRPIFVSKDDYVVDGHHQWAATVLANLRAGKDKFDLPVQRVDADIGTILDTSREYTTAMGLPQKAGTAKTIEAIKRLLSEHQPGQWVAQTVDAYTLEARARYGSMNNVLRERGLTRRGEQKAYDEGQPRDENGRWTASGGGQADATAKYEHPDNVASMSEEAFKANPPKGYRYATDLGTAIASHGRGGGTDISISPQFFGMDKGQRLSVLYHEIGHGLSDEMLRDGTAFDLADQGAMGPRWGIEKEIPDRLKGKGYDGRLVSAPNGVLTPGEAIAETYSILHDEPTFLRDKFPALGKAVIDAAEQHGYPVPSAAKDVVKTYDESQPRDENGRWTASGASEDALHAPPKAERGSGPAAMIGAAAHALDDPHQTPSDYKMRIQNELHLRLRDNPAWKEFVGVGPNSLRSFDSVSSSKVNALIAGWAQTSADSSGVALALQRAVQDEFNLKDASTAHMGGSLGPKSVDSLYEQYGGAYRAFVRAMYDNTQAELAKDGIKEMQLYRGMSFGADGAARAKQSGLKLDGMPHTVTTTQQPASSWSYSFTTAKGFAGEARHNEPGAVLAATVPASRILSTMKTGWGCKKEKEVVVLGGKDQVGAQGWLEGTENMPQSPHALLGTKTVWHHLELKGPARWQLGKLTVAGREVPRDHPDYYRLLQETMPIKRYRLMVGGEDLLSESL